jgi:3-oxoacyl-[acyl-carrier protein] reductase
MFCTNWIASALISESRSMQDVAGRGAVSAANGSPACREVDAIHASGAGGLQPSDSVAVTAAVRQVVTVLGGLDILVNNAGTVIPKTFEETTLQEMDRMIDVNLRGPLAATQAALKHMRAGARIIMVGSSVGERVLTPGLVAYSATKGAVKMFTQGLSREVGGRGITVNNVQPGPIDTELNPASGDWAVPQKATTALNRYGTVDEIAAMVAFLAGPESSYITGANLTVDGGTNA